MDDLRLFQAVHGSAGYRWSRTARRRESESLNMMVTGRLAHVGRSPLQPEPPSLRRSAMRGVAEWYKLVLALVLLANVQKP